MRPVFTGTVDEVRSSGSAQRAHSEHHGQGRRHDRPSRRKPQQRHFDDSIGRGHPARGRQDRRHYDESKSIRRLAGITRDLLRDAGRELHPRGRDGSRARSAATSGSRARTAYHVEARRHIYGGSRSRHGARTFTAGTSSPALARAPVQRRARALVRSEGRPKWQDTEAQTSAFRRRHGMTTATPRRTTGEADAADGFGQGDVGARCRRRHRHHRGRHQPPVPDGLCIIIGARGRAWTARDSIETRHPQLFARRRLRHHARSEGAAVMAPESGTR